MSVYNNFGATNDMVVNCYTGTVESDYTSADALTEVIDRAAYEVLGCMPDRVHQVLTEQVTNEALSIGGQTGTSFSLGLSPAVEGSAYAFVSDGRPAVTPEINGAYAIGSDQYSQSGQTLTLVNSLVETQWLLATYRINPTSATFAWPSMQQPIVIIAAAEAGARLYTGTAGGNTDLVQRYEDQANMWRERIKNGEWMPNEVRELTFYNDISPTVPAGAGAFGTVSIQRG
jgi:hypothetical protein